jgi:hypothetical protein
MTRERTIITETEKGNKHKNADIAAKHKKNYK